MEEQGNKITRNQGNKVTRQQEVKTCFLVHLFSCSLVFLLTCFLVNLFPCLAYTGDAFGIGWRQKQASGGFPGEYLTSFTAGARAAGMADAFSAVGVDGAIVYFNPAGLTGVGAKELSLLDSELFLGDRYNFLQYVHPFSLNRVFSISWINLASAKAKGRTLLGDETGDFQDIQRTFLISYAHKFRRPLSIGTNIKIVTQRIASYCDQGYGLDLGLLAGKKLKFGLCLQNLIPPKLRLIEQTDTFPANLRIGISYQCFHNKLILASDLSLLNIYRFNNHHPLRWWTGVEYRFLKLFALRAGINYKSITAGLGISTRKFSFDYAASFHNLGIIHHFNLKFRFGLLPTVEEKELAKKKEEFNRLQQVHLRQLVREKEEFEKKRDALEKLLAIAEKIEQQDYESAKILAEELLTAEPENGEVKKLLEIAKEKAEETVLERTLNLALKHFREEKYEDANGEFARVLALNPEQLLARELKHLTQVYLDIEEKKYSQAYQEVEQTLKINPDNQKARNLQKRLEIILGIVGSEK